MPIINPWGYTQKGLFSALPGILMVLDKNNNFNFSRNATHYFVLGCANTPDVVFLLDSPDTLQTMKTVLTDMILQLDIDKGLGRVGLVTFLRHGQYDCQFESIQHKVGRIIY